MTVKSNNVSAASKVYNKPSATNAPKKAVKSKSVFSGSSSTSSTGASAGNRSSAKPACKQENYYGRYNEKKAAKKVVTDLYNGIKGVSMSNTATRAAMSKIYSTNVAFICSEYKNKTGRTLARDLYGEFGIKLDEIKSCICNKLMIRINQLGITGIADYRNISDISKLDTWINNTIAKLDSATDTTVTADNDPSFAKDGIAKVAISMKESGATSTYYYKDGKVVTETTNSKRGTVRVLNKPSATAKDIVSNSKYETPKPLRISRSGDFTYNGANTANANAMMKSLEDNKAQLMKILNIDNKTYDEYAKLTLAIAERETNFGDACYIYDEGTKKIKRNTSKYIIQKTWAQSYYVQMHENPDVEGQNLPTITFDYVRGKMDKHTSFGLTGIKWLDIVQNSNNKTEEGKIYTKIQDAYKQLRINGPEDLYDPAKCACATMVYAKYKVDLLKAQMNADKSTTHHDLESRLQACPASNITEIDVAAHYWNSSNLFIKDSTFNPEDFEYNNSIKKNMAKYQTT